ncbi:MAG: transglutaminase-like cysteine peptidase [Methylobacteriaceae bacterium]|nr:transglutaminase-like cysteine peptidase [Methylobacteriaceae bacterium]
MGRGAGAPAVWCAALALAAGLIAGPVEGQTYAALPSPATVGKVETSGAARPVAAWLSFCDRYAGECDVSPSEPTSISLTPKTWRTLNAVNRQVNGSIKAKTDMDHWGVVDRWDLPDDGYGDCEDYQLLKRKILAEKHGIPRRAMRMTVVIDEQGEGHAVLMVRTDEGDLILDNKRNGILGWRQTGYVFVKREGQDSREWVSLGDRSGPVATANR